MIELTHNEIELKIKKLIEVCERSIKPDEVTKIKHALSFAQQKLDDLPQKYEKPLIANAIDIAIIVVKEIGLGVSSVLAALLLEVVRNKKAGLNDIAANFDKTTANIIDGLLKISELNTIKVFEKTGSDEDNREKAESSKDNLKKSKRPKAKKQMSFEKKLSLQSENFSKMLMAISDDVRVVLLQIAIRTNTLRNIKLIDENRIIGITRESAYLYAPIAHKLGLYNIKTEMEEFSMKYNQPEMYRFISKKLDETKADRNAFIQRFIDPLKKELAESGLNCEIKGRPKSIHSIWRKMKKQDVGFEGIYDLFAIRVILKDNFNNVKQEKEACWRVYSQITNVYTPNPKRLRDWISSPKSSGYESLHTTVLVKEKDQKWVEVQIRTERMDEIAEKGHAAHWKYKEVKGGESHDDWLTKIREMLEKQDSATFEKADQAKVDLYSNNIFVFTPKGELVTLPDNATVLDFAYHIHTRLGEICVGAKIDNSVVSIKRILRNGETIEIITSKQQQPKKEWLQIAVTPRAKNRIKRALKDELNEQAKAGKNIVVKKLSDKSIDINDKIIIDLREYFNIKSNVEFFAAVGRQEIKVDNAIEKIFGEHHLDNEAFIEELKKAKKQVEFNKSKDYLIVDNLGKIDYELAKCCNPIPGDNIFGFVTVLKGTKIHKISCPNAKEMMSRFPYRVVKAKWNNADLDSIFSAKIHVKGVNSVTLFSNILNVISHDLRIDLGDAHVNSEKGKMFDGEFTVYVSNTRHLETLTDKLKTIKGVLTVERKEFFD